MTGNMELDYPEYPPEFIPRHELKRLLAVAGIIGAVLVAILVLFSLVVVGCGCMPAPKGIGIACAKASLGAGYRCEITGADSSVDLAYIGARVYSADGEVVGTWLALIDFRENDSVPVLGPIPPLDPVSRIEDNGDRKLGVGDRWMMEPLSGKGLKGLSLHVYGSGGYGSDQLE